ncbi:GNAT family N-acetyltransferase [Allomuricauda sp. SCSIO 65647]|uniref:GNAT family N-acetyltransferase n=1 Tax=Allomuricauda sp. SCSIO 65647 TaxID=2908843 RepID=UPI001F1D7E99|nr:GNAT family N-acetyltransferase [Muricauda sp. SCSIO 65647]UJH67002.1 GNAT family N-acetyltransferase [Muricauda sp. SCSIO 65647]
MENGEVLPIFKGVRYFGNELQNNSTDAPKKKIDCYYSLRLVPEYMKPQMVLPSILKRNIIKQVNWGYAIHLDGTASIDEYLEGQFKSKYRSIIRRYVKRLEHCFPIRYELFYGEIDEDIYYFVMDSLRQMIVHRFGQRQETHKEFHRWQDLVKETYQKILDKDASLFVIYDGEHPIQISLNYHFDKILFSAISSYDIDYAKFGLGHIEIYKQLQWCIENGHCVYEMGVGGMDYKRRWSNTIYQYQHHIIYPENRPLAKLFASIEINRVKLKEYLKSKNVNELIYRVKDRIVKKKAAQNGTDLNVVNIAAVDTSISIKEYDELKNLKSEARFLKKYLYDFLYSKVENIDDVSVLQSQKDSKNFIFKGKSAAQHLEFEK